jgi:hypothetical protein
MGNVWSGLWRDGWGEVRRRSLLLVGIWRWRRSRWRWLSGFNGARVVEIEIEGAVRGFRGFIGWVRWMYEVARTGTGTQPTNQPTNHSAAQADRLIYCGP